MSADADPTADAFLVRVLLEVNLGAQPIEGSVSPLDGAPSQFIGWLGLTTALERLRVDRELAEMDDGRENTTEGSTMRSARGRA